MANTTMTDITKQVDAYTTQLLARVMYHKWCDYKNVTPRPYPYADAGSQDYAATAVEMLGYDDDGVAYLRDYLTERGDNV